VTRADEPPLPALTWGRNRFLEVDGERIHLVERGESGPRLLLVHGFPSNSISWRLIMERLAERFRMAAVDMVGFGWSTRFPTRGLTGDLYAQRLAALLGVMGWDRAHIAGLSWGGGVAQRLAAAHPGRVDRLVLAASVDPSRTLWLGTGGLRLAIRQPAFARLVVARALRGAAARSGMPARELAHAYIDPLQLPGTREFLRRFVVEHRASSHLDQTRIEAPTLVIGPLADRIVPPAVSVALARHIRGARYEPIPDVGHQVHFEAPDRVAELMAGFLWGSAVEKPSTGRESRG
jgi:pimeloyl-ACP methyl ester carboxylesterase